jgi:hypothetical protein
MATAHAYRPAGIVECVKHRTTELGDGNSNPKNVPSTGKSSNSSSSSRAAADFWVVGCGCSGFSAEAAAVGCLSDAIMTVCEVGRVLVLGRQVLGRRLVCPWLGSNAVNSCGVGDLVRRGTNDERGCGYKAQLDSCRC